MGRHEVQETLSHFRTEKNCNLCFYNKASKATIIPQE